MFIFTPMDEEAWVPLNVGSFKGKEYDKVLHLKN
jgi:hypothetical protein